MAARSIASLSLSFGLVSIPVRLYSATESSATIRFNLLAKDGGRVRQQYVSESDQSVVERRDMVKGYEFEKDRFVLFTPDELKALEEGSRHTIDIVAFIPEKAVDPIYYDKAYFLAPDKRGGKPYALLREAMKSSGRCALATWAWKTKQYVVQVRPSDDGIVLQQLLYADEVRKIADLDIEPVTVSQSELKLALQLIDQISEDSYDPTAYVDEEKKRVLAEIDRKIAGQEIVAAAHHEDAEPSNVIDLMDALRKSLQGKAPVANSATKSAAKIPAKGAAKSAPPKVVAAESAAKERKPIRRAAAKAAPAKAEPAPQRARARK
jgi:DNA end-binding protein Ku